MSRFSLPPEKHNGDGKHDRAGYDRFEDDVADFPTLAEFIGTCRYSNGDPRETGSILLFCDDGQLKVMFKEPNEGVVGFARIEGLSSILGDLEALLEGGRVDWRRDKQRRKGYR